MNLANLQIQQQVVKVLLAAINSAVCGVHEASLLRAFRACCNVHLLGRSLVTQLTAKATLTQTILVVLQRAEGLGTQFAGKGLTPEMLGLRDANDTPSSESLVRTLHSCEPRLKFTVKNAVCCCRRLSRTRFDCEFVYDSHEWSCCQSTVGLFVRRPPGSPGRLGHVRDSHSKLTPYH